MLMVISNGSMFVAMIRGLLDIDGRRGMVTTLLELALEDHRNIPIKIWEHKLNIKMW